MPRKANKPPAAEWERHKPRILSLASQHQWSEVVEKMEKEYSFVASADHFDAQMRTWGVHKNLKQHEWRAALRVYDKISSRHDRKIRMRILGSIVSEKRLQKSRSRCSKRSHTDTAEQVPSHVTFEAQAADGTWSQCPTTDKDNEQPQPVVLEHRLDNGTFSLDALLPDFLNSDITPTDNQLFTPSRDNGTFSLDTLLPIFSNIDVDLTDTQLFTPSDNRLSSRGIDRLLTPICESDTFLASSFCNGSARVSSPLSAILDSPSLSQFLSYFLDNLPSQQFQDNLEVHGITLATFNSTIPSNNMHRPNQSLMPCFRNPAHDVSSSNVMLRAAQFLFLSNLPEYLQSLLPGEATEDSNEKRYSLIAEDAILESKFYRLLLFSILNGFTGLGDIPIAKILEFLAQHENIGMFFAQAMKVNPGYAAKSMAENLFKAAVEARQSHFVKHLLGTGLFDINDIIFAHGLRMTAIEKVVATHDPKILEIIINAGADVNKHYHNSRGTLFALLLQLLNEGTVSAEDRAITQLLLHAGSTISVDGLFLIMGHFRDEDFLSTFLSTFLQLHASDEVHIPINLFAAMILSIDQETCYESGKLIIKTCERLHKASCLRIPMENADDALIISSAKGHLGLVQLWLPYAMKYHAALSASFRSGKREVVDTILAKISSFDAPASRIECLQGGLIAGNTTTPFAEAIKTQRVDFIELCEEKGALMHLHVEGHFSAALDAAVHVDNMSYVNKLFLYRPAPEPEEMFQALLSATKRNKNYMALRLLEMGAPLWSYDQNKIESALGYAVQNRNEGLLYTFLNSGVSLLPGFQVEEWWMNELIKWGNRSIILDLLFAIPWQMTKLEHMRYSVNRRDLGIGGLDLDIDDLAFLNEQGLLSSLVIERLLQTPMKNGNTTRINQLLELQAMHYREENLILAVETNQLSTLKLLLGRISGPTLKSFGGITVCTAVRGGFSRLEALDILLSSRVINICHSKVIRSAIKAKSPLGWAIWKAEEFQGHFLIVERLLEAGCDPNIVVSTNDEEVHFNMTGLLAAIATKKIRLVRLLLDKGANINTPASRGLTRTPLQWASELGCLDIVKLLLKKGAEVNAPPVPCGGGTALQLAAISGNCNVLVELLDHGADLLALPSKTHGRWPLEGAAEHGRLDMIALILRIQLYNAEQCQRAMKFAKGNGHMGCRDMIQEYVDTFEGTGLG